MGRLSDFGIEAFGEWMIIRAHFLKSVKSFLIMYKFNVDIGEAPTKGWMIRVSL